MKFLLTIAISALLLFTANSVPCEKTDAEITAACKEKQDAADKCTDEEDWDCYFYDVDTMNAEMTSSTGCKKSYMGSMGCESRKCFKNKQWEAYQYRELVKCWRDECCPADEISGMSRTEVQAENQLGCCWCCILMFGAIIVGIFICICFIQASSNQSNAMVIQGGMQPGMMVQQGGMKVMQPGMYQRPGMMVQQPGMMMQQPRIMVQQPGMMMQQPGMVVQQPGMMMQQPGMVVLQPGMMMQQPVNNMVRPSQPMQEQAKLGQQLPGTQRDNVIFK